MANFDDWTVNIPGLGKLLCCPRTTAAPPTQSARPSARCAKTAKCPSHGLPRTPVQSRAAAAEPLQRHVDQFLAGAAAHPQGHRHGNDLRQPLRDHPRLRVHGSTTPQRGHHAGRASPLRPAPARSSRQRPHLPAALGRPAAAAAGTQRRSSASRRQRRGEQRRGRRECRRSGSRPSAATRRRQPRRRRARAAPLFFNKKYHSSFIS